jgi:hypothetical protein
MAQSLTTGSETGVAAAPSRSLWRRFERWRARRAQRTARWAADAELVRRDSPPLRLAWRVEELVATKNRMDLAHSLRSLVRDSRPRYLPSASPVNRLAVRAESEALLSLASRISELDRPVAARGVLLVDRLLVDGSGPLYDRERIDELPLYLDTALGALDPR